MGSPIELSHSRFYKVKSDVLGVFQRSQYYPCLQHALTRQYYQNSCLSSFIRKTQTNVFIYFVERIVCLGEMQLRQKHDLALQAIMSLVMCSPNNHLSSSLNHEILTRVGIIHVQHNLVVTDF